MAMTDDRTAPLVTPGASSTRGDPAAAAAMPSRHKKPGLLSRVLFGRRSRAASALAPGGGADHESQRLQWEQERKMLLDDCTAVRAEAAGFERALEGYTAMLRDLLHFSLFHGKHADLKEFFTDRLRESVGEIEGVHEVEITELRLPLSSDHAPQLGLVRYCGPELSEWSVKWEPPTAAVGGAISLRGRKFGVSFTIVVAVGALKAQGLIMAKWTPGTAEPQLQLGFKTLPKLTFDVQLVGKALSLGSDTLRAWLVRQTEKALLAHWVLPNLFVLDLPFFHGPEAPLVALGEQSAAAPSSPLAQQQQPPQQHQQQHQQQRQQQQPPQPQPQLPRVSGGSGGSGSSGGRDSSGGRGGPPTPGSSPPGSGSSSSQPKPSNEPNEVEMASDSSMKLLLSLRRYLPDLSELP